MVWYKPWDWGKLPPPPPTGITPATPEMIEKYEYVPPVKEPVPGAITPTTRGRGEIIVGPTITEIAETIEEKPLTIIPSAPPPPFSIAAQMERAEAEDIIKKMPGESEAAYRGRVESYERGFGITYAPWKPKGWLYERGYRPWTAPITTITTPIVTPKKETFFPTVIEPAPFWYRKYPSKVKGAVLRLGEAFEPVTTLGGLLEYKPRRKPVYEMVGKPAEFPRRETLIYEPITKAKMTPEQRVQYTVEKAGTKAYFKSKVISTKLAEEYQEKIEKGILGVTEAQVKYEKEYKLKVEPIEKTYKEKIKKAEYKYGAEVMVTTLPLTFAKGITFGVITAVAPPVALGIAGVGAAEIGFKWRDVREQFRTYPGLSVAQVGVGLVGAGVGVYGTALGVGKIKGYIPTIGKEPITPTKLIEPKVLLGKRTFPTAPPKEHLKLFLKSRYKLPGETRIGVWHTTPKKFLKEAKVTAGASEIPGLYGAPSVSPHFLKISKPSYKFFGVGMESVLIGKPGILRIYPKKIIKGMPRKPGYAYVPGIKTEIEAIIPAETILRQMGVRYYTTWRGRRVPIYEYKALTGKPIITKPSITLGKVSREYYLEKPSLPFVTPYGISYAVSKIYRPSYKPIYKISYPRVKYKIPPYKISYLKYPKPYVSYKYPTPSYKPYLYPITKKPYYPYPKKRLPVIPILEKPEIELPDGRRFIKRRKGIKPTRETFYIPSLPAIAYKIKAFKIPRGYEIGAGPVIRRPIIKAKKKKGKKRKKKK